MSRARWLRLREAVCSDPELTDWLAAGDRRWRDGESLERALDFSGPGAERVACEALLRAAHFLDAAGERSVWATAVLLEQALARFASRTWPRVRQGDGLDSLNDLDRTLWEVLSSGARYPASARRLFDLLTERGWQRQSPSREDGRGSSEDPDHATRKRAIHAP